MKGLNIDEITSVVTLGEEVKEDEVRDLERDVCVRYV